MTLKPEYLKTLKTGTYDITFLFEDGEAKTTFSVKAGTATNGTSPKTGDTANALLYISLLGASALTAVVVYKKKKAV